MSTTTRHDDIDFVVEKLVEHECKPHRSADHVDAKCPAHNDHKPSLSIDRGDERSLVLRCHAGCDTADVLAALGTSWPELARLNGNGNGTGRVEVDEYPYHDELGELLYSKVRYHPKDFRQCRPDGNGGRVWNLHGTRRVLFNLPAVRHAIERHEPVFICEGEKDVNALGRVGVTATTNSGGAAEKWLAAYTEQLKGASDVVIVTDRDPIGREHAADVLASLEGRVGSVRVVEAMAGCHDAFDHLAAGHTVDDFVPVDVTADGEHDDDADELGSFAPIDLRPALRGEKVWPTAEVFKRDDGVALLSPGIGYLFGDSGDGKSFVALIACLLELRLGHRVVWITYEDANEAVILERLKQLGATDDECMLLTFSRPDEPMTTRIKGVTNLVRSTGARLLVLDSIGEAMAMEGINEDRDNEVGPWFLRTLRALHNAMPELAILPIDHSTKAKDAPLFPSGSKRKRAMPTGRMFLLTVGKSFGKGVVGYVRLVVAKDRGGLFARGAIAADIMLDATEVPYRWSIRAPREGDTYEPKAKRRNAEERVAEVLGGATVPLTTGQVHRMVNEPDRRQPAEAELSAKGVQNALTSLAKRASVVKLGDEKDRSGRSLPMQWLQVQPDRDGV